MLSVPYYSCQKVNLTEKNETERENLVIWIKTSLTTSNVLHILVSDTM